MFALVFRRTAKTPPVSRSDGERMLGALMPFAPPDKSGVLATDHALVAQAIHYNTVHSLYEATPQVCEKTGRIIAGSIRLDNRDSLCAALKIENRPKLTDPLIVLAAHRVWGAGCALRLEGDFSFVIYDRQASQVYCARDAIGTRPFYYHLSEDHFIAASSVAAIRALGAIDLSPRTEWIALLASGFNFLSDASAFAEIDKLPDGHDLVVERQGSCKPRRYHSFDTHAPQASRRDSIWVERYLEAFDRAVDVRARSEFLIGAENSGGLDSASLIARLAQVLPHPIDKFHTFGIAFDEDEPEKIEAVSRKCGVQHTHVTTRPEMLRIDEVSQRALKVIGHPPEHGQALMHANFFEQANDLGIRTMMSGYGGDEIVTNQAGHLFDELLAGRKYAAAFGEVEGALPLRLARFVKRAIRGPDGPDASRSRLVERKLEISCLSREFLEDTGLKDKITEWMVPQRPDHSVNSIATSDAGFRYARMARLESSALFASSYGIEFRYPLFDRALIQQYLSTPSIEKRKGRMGRYLHRRAMEGRIPPDIQWQQSKSMGGPIGGGRLVETFSPIPATDLPQGLREIIDHSAFEDGQRVLAEEEDDMSDFALRTRFFLWQVRQLTVWLDGL